MDKMINSEDFDSTMDSFDDELDCAILDDEDMMRALTGDESVENEVIDTSIDYTDAPHTPDVVDTDADDYIAAERDIIADPFEDEDIMDAATDGDEDVDLSDDD